MFRRLFLDHPAEVGESYRQHFGVAMRFGMAMIGGGLAAVAHALCPALFKQSASRIVLRLHAQLAANRRGVENDGVAATIDPRDS